MHSHNGDNEVLKFGDGEFYLEPDIDEYNTDVYVAENGGPEMVEELSEAGFGEWIEVDEEDTLTNGKLEDNDSVYAAEVSRENAYVWEIKPEFRDQSKSEVQEEYNSFSLQNF